MTGEIRRVQPRTDIHPQKSDLCAKKEFRNFSIILLYDKRHCLPDQIRERKVNVGVAVISNLDIFRPIRTKSITTVQLYRKREMFCFSSKGAKTN